MKNSIVIGPIKKNRPTTERASILKDRLTKMKVGNFFEISGISSKSDAMNIRASLGYFSKKENIKLSTSLNDGVLTVERIKSSSKTKETSKVK
jgi:hypothetical protein